jgi:hypothetical protein
MALHPRLSPGLPNTIEKLIVLFYYVKYQANSEGKLKDAKDYVHLWHQGKGIIVKADQKVL